MSLRRQQQKRGLASIWKSQNPVLLDGELGVETDTRLIKMGDGVTAWNSLLALSTRKSDTSANYTAANPTLANLEIAYESDTRKFKVGDGVTAWRNLNYYAADALVRNVKDHGVIGDGVADDTVAIQAALDTLAEGAILFFPQGTYLISAPLVLRRNKTIMGTYTGLWPYDTGSPCRIKAASNFVGNAMVQLTDEEAQYGSVGAPANGLYVGPNDQSGMCIFKITLDGFNVAGGVDGILASGLIRSVRLSEVTVRRCSGSGIHTVGYTRLNATTVYPRGWRLEKVTVEANANMGFATNLLNDSTFMNCLAVGNTSHGYYIAGPGETILVGCRSAFNKGRGYYITGSSYGNVVLSACTTDRSELSGCYIDTTGKHPILLSGCAFRRDGRNGNGGGGGYAGLMTVGATNPIIVNGITTETGQDDDGTGTMSPQYGVRASTTTALVISSGVIHGFTSAYSDGGGNGNVRISPLVIQVTGSINAPVTTYIPDVAPFPQPVDQGFAAWAYDPALAVNTATNALVSGVLTLVKVRLTVPTTLSTLSIYIATAGATLTAGQSLAGIYNAAGTLLGTSADQAASWATTGAKNIGLVAASGQSLASLPPGTYFLALLSVGTTMPALVRASGQAAINQGLAAGAYRFASYGSALTALPASLTMANQVAASIATWAAVA